MPERRLAAIMFTDIVGYTAMMQADEKNALQKLQHHRDVLESLTEEYGGEVLNYYGDGSLSIYNSAVEAVECAVKMQHELKEAPVVPLRIGIHVGDIVYGEGQIYGDGVNLASRLESLGVPHSIMISERVLSDIRNQAQFATTSLGIFEFKNVEKPMEVFAIANPGLSIPEKHEIKGKLKPTGKAKMRNTILARWVIFGLIGIFLVAYVANLFFTHENAHVPVSKSPIIVVAPFEYDKGLEDQAHLAESIDFDIRANLTNIDELIVLAEFTSSKIATMGLSEIRDRFLATHMIEGRLLLVGDSLIIKPFLIDVNTGVQMGLGKYSFKPEQFSIIANEISLRVIERLQINISDAQNLAIAKVLTDSTDALMLYHKGRFMLNRFTDTAIQESISLFSKAIAIDSLFAEAYALRASAYIQYGATWHGSGKGSQAVLNALQDIERALEINSELSEAYYTRASLNLFTTWNFEKTENDFIRAYEYAKPGASLGSLYGFFLFVIRSQFEEALVILNREHDLDPLNEQVAVDLGAAQYYSGKKQAGFNTYHEALKLNDKHPPLALMLAELNFREGNIDEALKFARLGDSLEPNNVPTVLYFQAWSFAKEGQAAKVDSMMQIISEFQLQGGNSRFDYFYSKAMTYGYLGLNELSFEALNESVKKREIMCIVLNLDKSDAFKGIQNEPRFHDLMTEIGLQPE